MFPNRIQKKWDGISVGRRRGDPFAFGLGKRDAGWDIDIDEALDREEY